VTITADWLQWPETRELIAAFSSEPDSFRFVGGAVRDALLGRDVSDVDAATTLLPDATMSLLNAASIRVIPTGIAHGTVTAMVGQRHFEITTLRNDVACDGRHADVSFTQSWRDDAARRDFTMNAMYVSPEGELFDYFGGQEDAKAGRVRFIGDARERIAEDRLRILRFFRFHAHYGVGMPDAVAVAACAKAACHMSALSGERVQAELVKLLSAAHAGPTLLLMQEQGILDAALGVQVSAQIFVPLHAVVQRVGVDMSAALKLAGFVWHEPLHWDALSKRLRLSSRLDKTVRLLFSFKDSISVDVSVAKQKQILRRMGKECFMALVLLCWASGEDHEAWGAMIALAQQWEAPVFPVSGDDLIVRGFSSGKMLGEQLHQLETVWEQSDYTLSGAELLSLLPNV